MTLVEALGIGPGVTAFIGAGGKTSAIFRCASELAALGAAVAIATTTHMFPPAPGQADALLVGAAAAALEQAVAPGKIVVYADALEGGKLCGAGCLARVAGLAGYVLAEADGAGQKPLKLPAAHEPAIPVEAEMVVGVMGLSALGQMGSAACHRWALHSGADSAVAPELLAALATSAEGLQKGVGGRRFALLLNQWDAADVRAAEEAARLAAKAGVSRVVLASLQQERWERRDICLP